MAFWDMVITIVTEQLSKLLAPAGILSWLPAGVRAAYYATVSQPPKSTSTTCITAIISFHASLLISELNESPLSVPIHGNINAG